jgi:hypothetical protein
MMAVIWTNIENGESGLSVRGKLNIFNTSLVTENTTIDTKINDLEDDITALSSNAHKVGFADYNDLATATTPISVTGGVGYVDITNDTLGSFTNLTYLPEGVSNVWNGTSSLFEFTELSLGDMIDIRLDIEVTTTANNQEVEVVLELGTNTTPYEIPYTVNSFKSSGTYKINKYNGFYIGSNDTLTGGGKFKIKSDANCTVKVNGWYVKLTIA